MTTGILTTMNVCLLPASIDHDKHRSFYGSLSTALFPITVNEVNEVSRNEADQPTTKQRHIMSNCMAYQPPESTGNFTSCENSPSVRL